jgi:asparagine synthase (glutamine-hydrolysing)
MCSIFGVLDVRQDLNAVRQMALRQSRLLRHRGPDWSGIYSADNAVLAHERLSIVRDRFEGDYAFRTHSDCEVILPLYLEKGPQFLDELSGMYAFCLYDEDADRWMMARDPIGIIPLYYGHDAHGQLFVASEMKALVDVCNQVHEFPPGHYWVSGQEEPQRWYCRDWEKFQAVENAATDQAALREALERAVVSHLMTDVPYGVLLSGGLDSSITAALAAKHAAMRVEDHEEKPAWWPRLHSFAIGLEGSPDLEAAQRAADHIGTVHHGFTFTIQEGLDALEEVIYHLETYDVTTIRAATPMFLMARKIRAMGIKMVLSGEGADEIFGGYLYFHKAPNPQAFHEETVRKLSRLHSYDCLRANKSMAAWGVEARVPFLDKEFLDVAMGINPADKMIGSGRMEKHILREAFEDLLPESIAWRQKEQFSDGVGYGWIDAVKDFTSERVSDAEMARAAGRFPFNTPASKEAYWFRSVFEQHFPLASAAQTVPGGPTIACSTPEAVLWDKALQEMNDPSGRAMRSVHEHAY